MTTTTSSIAPVRPEATPAPTAPAAPTSAARLLAVLRILLGFMLVWDVVDKVFGLGISTPAAKSWLAGVSPTAGYLASLHGPAGILAPLAGQAWVDWAFMGGMLLIGAALMLGIGLRAAAAAGTLLFALLWVSAMPTQNNPFVDEHVIFALLLWVLAVTRAGDVWGFGRPWDAITEQRVAWLRQLG
jgi:thiosulfate dehydrogenase [quinone] large subunit